MIARTVAGLRSRLEVMGSFSESGESVINWRGPPGNSEVASAFREHYTEAPSALSRDRKKFVNANPTDAVTFAPRPKRADARRNYEKLLAAAREEFAEE